MKKKDPIIIQTHFLLGFLFLQFLLGMFTNLFVEFPDKANEKTLWEFSKNQMPIVLHMVIAALLVIGGIVLLVRTIRKKDKQWIIAASVGLVALLFATFAGAQFIPSQQDSYSYIMAIGFILAVFSYGWGLVKSSK
ncbi:MAG TPA: hypothetical protein VLF93_04445 [Candidatus Saccharimonadales bacterium]|nr:hypothetical protein [Candidatus Saccharimonadales bacterium]